MHPLLLACLLGVTAISVSTVHGADWSYEGEKGPENWHESFELCDNQRQSPIDLDHSMLVYDENLGQINFGAYDEPQEGLTLLNNGHAVQVNIAGDTQVQVSGAKLPTDFKLAQFHFHWADSDDLGAEHHFDGELHPMELHFVHYNTEYGSLSEAAVKVNGLAVIGVFIEVGEENAGFDPLISQLPNIPFKDDNVPLEPFAMDDLLPADRDDFFRYQGSLTTPPCYESVIWTVLESKVYISHNQMQRFREGLYQGSVANATERIVNNFRPAQELNGRTITSSHRVHTAKPAEKKVWSYEGQYGPENWKQDFEICGHAHQSPIDIDHTLMLHDQRMGDINFTAYEKRLEKLILTNNGHAVQVNVPSDAGVYVSGAKLPGVFQLAQFHAHWADSDDLGAEHHLDGELHPMEIHFVHYNTKYGSLSEAANKRDGLAVVGVFIEVGGEDNENFQRLIKDLHRVPHKGAEWELEPFAMAEIIPEDRAEFFRYQGSLTTPPCYESVTWTVLESKVYISAEQMDEFRRGLYEGDDPSSTKRIRNNFRPAQPLNNRLITSSHPVISRTGPSRVPPTKPTSGATGLLVSHGWALLLLAVALFKAT